MSQHASVPRIKAQPLVRLLLSVAAVALAVWAFVTFVPGYIASDDVAYDWAARAFSHGNGLDLGNSYADVQSIELQQPHAQSVLIARGRLVSKYPSGFPLVASLFYGSLGLRALGMLNALSLPAILLATWLIGRRLLRSEWLALCAAGLMVAATFVVQYGRDVWPHAVTLALLMAGTASLVTALDGSTGRRRLALVAIAGLCTGLALNARVDAMLYIAALGLALLLERPISLTAPLAFAAGTLPGLLLLSLDNSFKWGSFYPLAYSANVGSELRFSSQFLPVSCLGLAVVVLRHAAALPFVRSLVVRSGRSAHLMIWLGFGLAGAAALAIPSVRHAAWGWARGTYALLFDLSSIGVELDGRVARGRTELGSYVSADGIRTGLLQDCPFLVLAALPFLVRRRARRGAWLALFVPALFLPLAFGWSSWQGGGGASLRYFLPLLPLGSVAAVEAIRHLRPQNWTKLTVAALVLGALAAILLWWVVLQTPRGSYLVELVRSPISTGIALCMTIFVLLRGLGTRRLRRFSRAPLALLIGATLAWSVASCHAYVSPLAQRQREIAAHVAGIIRREMTPDALVFLDYPAPTSSQITVAYPGVDNARDAWHLIDAFHARGQRIFGIMDQARWDMVMTRPEARGGLLRLGSARTVIVAEILPDGMR